MQSLSASVSLFNGCLHAYRAVCCAAEMGADSVIWDVRMRTELTRFEVWGRMLRFLDERTGEETITRVASSTVTLDLADILQIDAAPGPGPENSQLARETLNDFKNVASKYRLDLRSMRKLPRLVRREAGGWRCRCDMYGLQLRT